MSKRKRQPVKRVRRSPYERSLDYATNRLDKAIQERDRCAAQLAALDKEIPYLQTVIRALTPPKEPIRHAQITTTIGKIDDSRNGLWGHGRNGPVGPPIPDNIKPFVEPISANVDELPSEEEQFLNVKIPGETELLP